MDSEVEHNGDQNQSLDEDEPIEFVEFENTVEYIQLSAAAEKRC